MQYTSSQYEADIQTITIDDPRLQRVLGDKLSMIILRINKEKTGNYSVHLKESKN